MGGNKYPSIFNDVLGPIMRGPSSSHSAASVRIGRMARDLMDGNIREVLVEFDPKGSLATTHESQGSDMGLFAGFLGWEADDERLPEYKDAVKEAGLEIQIKINNIEVKHPNTYKLTLKNENELHEIVAISTGGGMIEIIEIDHMEVSMIGDCYETLIYTEGNNLLEFLQSKEFLSDSIGTIETKQKFIEIKGKHFLEKESLTTLKQKFPKAIIKMIDPVLPILSSNDVKVPFTTCEDMLQYNKDKQWDLWKLAVHYESMRGNISFEEVFTKMKKIISIMRESIQTGIKGTNFADRILGFQSGKFKTQLERKNLLDGGILNQIIVCITAMMEIKSSLGVIVAAPTAGACGTIPGALIGATSVMNLSNTELTQAMFAAGMIGVFISQKGTFSAEIGGCQAECGSASGMAAAGLVTLKNGTIKQVIDAASMALQNSFGMVCDPVANRVEVPCLGKNVMAASNALACANMALADYDVVIPLDEVIEAMDQVGRSIAHELKCTALGGLSITRTSREIEERLKSK